jgi:hypothetical protein
MPVPDQVRDDGSGIQVVSSDSGDRRNNSGSGIQSPAQYTFPSKISKMMLYVNDGHQIIMLIYQQVQELTLVIDSAAVKKILKSERCLSRIYVFFNQAIHIICVKVDRP